MHFLINQVVIFYLFIYLFVCCLLSLTAYFKLIAISASDV